MAMVIAACSGADDDTTAPDTAASTTDAPISVSTAAPSTLPEPTTAPTTDAPVETAETAPEPPVDAATVEQINEYVAEAASFDQAAADAQFPAGLTFAAGGAPGYSRYVFRENTAGVVPTLVEGPLLDAVRCQDPDLPCSR